MRSLFPSLVPDSNTQHLPLLQHFDSSSISSLLTSATPNPGPEPLCRWGPALKAIACPRLTRRSFSHRSDVGTSRRIRQLNALPMVAIFLRSVNSSYHTISVSDTAQVARVLN
jgi:hypothetical protein